MRRSGLDEARDALGDPGTSGEQVALANPNLDDLPVEAGRSEGEAVQGNPFWSEWADMEFQLQRMRPSELPSQGALGEALMAGGIDSLGSGCGANGVATSTQGIGTRSVEVEASWNSGTTEVDDAIAIAALELDRQTSMGHYPRERARDFLENEADWTLQEPEYYHIGTPDRGANVSNDDARENRTGTSLLREGEVWPGSQGRGTVGSLAVSAHRTPLLETLTGRPRDGERTLADGGQGRARREGSQIPISGQLLRESHVQSMPTQELYRAVEASSPWLIALVRRLEEAEARSRSSASYHSVLEPVQRTDGTSRMLTAARARELGEPGIRAGGLEVAEPRHSIGLFGLPPPSLPQPPLRPDDSQPVPVGFSAVPPQGFLAVQQPGVQQASQGFPAVQQPGVQQASQGFPAVQQAGVQQA